MQKVYLIHIYIVNTKSHENLMKEVKSNDSEMVKMEKTLQNLYTLFLTNIFHFNILTSIIYEKLMC